MESNRRVEEGSLRSGSHETGVVREVVYRRITANIGRTNNVRLYKFLTSSDGINYVRSGQWVSLSRWLAEA